ncbi:MAG: hypothetical protein MZV63_36645 [Marinilabiliales bacterium]|nr:hypothetical protein [Marinilabiliales bacterium]
MMDQGMIGYGNRAGNDNCMEMLPVVGCYTFFAVVGNFFMGMIFSLITAIFVKKEDTGFEQPVEL